jgi:uncharacterized damage-inducible protein DinB
MNLIDRYRRWFEYEKDAHAKVLAAFETVPAERRGEEGYQKALTLFAHMMAARRLWLYRFGAYHEAPKDFFPKDVTLAELREQSAHVNAIWERYFSRLEENELERQFEYRSLDGNPFRNVIEDVLAQLFGHSWYHRGQIALLIRSLGGAPAVTDFVYWTREAMAR